MTAQIIDISHDLRFPAPIANIIADVAYQMHLPKYAVIGPGRTQTLVQARAAVVWLSRELIEASNCMLGRALGDRRHGVIETAYQTAAKLRLRDADFRRRTDQLRDHYRNLQED